MSSTKLHIGLEGIAIAESSISYANGTKGELIYRGAWAGDLAEEKTFEEVLYLLWHGRLPFNEELTDLKQALAARRTLPEYMRQLIQLIPKDVSYMAVLRSALSTIIPEGGDWPPTINQAIDILAKAPSILTYRYSFLAGKEPVEPHLDLDHVNNYLYMLMDKEQDPGIVRALSTYLILCMDHDINASTFTARIVTSTQADIVSAICAAISALIGPLHGGAPSRVDDLLIEIGTKENAEEYLRDKLKKNDRLMGFGHRVYKTWDPRAAALKRVAERLVGKDPLFDLSLYVEGVAFKLLKHFKPGRNLYPNVEYWAAAILRAAGLPRELYTATFCCSRIAGWSAHIMEQAANNRLIRPTAIYVGSRPNQAEQR